MPTLGTAFKSARVAVADQSEDHEYVMSAEAMIQAQVTATSSVPRVEGKQELMG